MKKEFDLLKQRMKQEMRDALEPCKKLKDTKENRDRIQEVVSSIVEKHQAILALGFQSILKEKKL